MPDTFVFSEWLTPFRKDKCARFLLSGYLPRSTLNRGLSRVPWMGEVGLALRHRVCDENLLPWAWWLEGRTVMLGTVVYFQPDAWE